MKKNSSTFKRFSKAFIVLMLLALFTPITFVEAAASPSVIHIKINGVDVPYDNNYGFPFIDQNNRTQVPLRVTLEALGAIVYYDQNLKVAYIAYNTHVISVPINESYIIVDGKKVMNDTSAVIYNDRTYCPIRIILESLGATVNYDSASTTVNISLAKNQTSYADGFDGNFKASFSVPTLVLLVSYSDMSLSTTESQWSEFFFGEAKSVADYYAAMSNNHLSVIPASESYGTTDDGVIMVHLDTEHPNYTYVNPNYTSIKTQPNFENIIKGVDAYIDFKQYDKDQDGYVSSRELAINIIVAGDEESYYREKSVKATSGVMVSEGTSTKADGVNLAWYTMTGEMYAQDFGLRPMSTLGVATHEFGHLLGLPDLYDLDYSTVGLAFHSLMASGNNNFNFDYGFGEYPAPMIAWSRMFAGLIEPYEVTQSGKVTLFSNAPYYNIVKVPTQDPDIYYLIENREFNDYGVAWNLYMDFGGVAIWRINEAYIDKYNFDNQVETVDSQRGITLIEAPGNNDLLKKELDIYYTRYNHYFQLNYINRWVSPEGIIFDILDPSSTTMNVNITFPTN